MAIGYESLTVSSTAKILTASVYADNVEAWITVEDDDIRVTFDGTAPVATTTGHLVLAGESIRLTNHGQIAGFKAIRESGDAKIKCSYFHAVGT